MLYGRYPDPDTVVYPTTGAPQFRPQLTSRNSGKLYPLHAHTAFVAVNGEGATDVVAGHFHRVRNWRVLPDESDGHTHALTGLPAGAG